MKKSTQHPFEAIWESPRTDTQLSSQIETIGLSLTDVVSKFETKFASLERTFQDQCKTVNGFYAKINAAGGPETPASQGQLDDKKEAKPADENSTSSWQQQKQAMMAQYGGDPGQLPLDQANADAESEEPSTEHTPVTNSDEVEKLKAELNSKLREVEVELSINRARLSQERAEFERNQAELDRRTAKLDAKLAAMNGDDDDGSDLSSRFKRHLGS